MDDEPIELPVEDIFDLHTIQPKDVRPAVEAYLDAAWEKGYAGVRIIHGRGIGVQRELVRKVLANTPFVRSFEDAPLEAGGWGATVVSFYPRAPV